MVPPLSMRIPRVHMYSGYPWPISSFTYRTVTFFGRPSHAVRLDLMIPFRVHTPIVLLQPVWPLPISLAATFGIDVSFSSSAYLDVSVQRVPGVTLWIHVTSTEVFSARFPHSEISGSKDICSSPKLFAAYHVFHRLLVPRHPPCALSRLTFISAVASALMGLRFVL